MFDASAVVRQEVRDLERGSIRDQLAPRREFVRLDRNEKLLRLDEQQFEDLRRSLTQETLSAYPILSRIYQKLARRLGVTEHHLFLSSGSDLAIRALYDTCVDHGDNVVVHSPSYFMYDVYARLHGAEARSIPIGADWTADVAAMLGAVDARTKLVFIEDPSGFVGTRVSRDAMEQAAKALSERNVLLVIDEAYLYVENTASRNLPFVEQYENVVLAQTMSKAHGLAGARFGYLISTPELMGFISKVRPLYELSGLSAWAAEWHLDHPEVIDAFQQSIKSNKARIMRRLQECGVEYRDAHANFILVRLDRYEKSATAEEQFKAQGVLVRRPFDETTLQGWVRVTVGDDAATERFLEALQHILGPHAAPLSATAR